MTGFNHVLAGVTIAVTVQQPVLAPLLALASHFLLDMVPHFGGPAWFEKWGRPLLTIAIADGLLSLLFVTFAMILFPQNSLLILICAVFATLPDWLWILYYKYKIKHKFFDFHLAIQRYERPWGAYVELGFCGLLIGLLWNLGS